MEHLIALYLRKTWDKKDWFYGKVADRSEQAGGVGG
jgi:hypothetical protein